MVCACCAGLFVLGGVAGVATRAAFPDTGRVPGGTVIGGVPVGNLTVDEAVAVLDARATPVGDTIRVDTPDGELLIPVARLKPRPASRQAVERAIAADTYGDRLRRGLHIDGTRRIPLSFRLPAAAREEVTDRVEAEVARPARPASVRVDGTTVTVTAAVPGRRLDRAVFARRIGALPAHVDAPVRTVPADVSTQAATAAKRRIDTVLARPVRIRREGRTVTLGAGDLAPLVTTTAQAGRLRVSLDERALGARLERDFPGVAAQARSAEFRVRGDRVTVVPAREGRDIDVTATAQAILAAPSDGTVPLAVTTTAPLRTTADARSLRIRELVAEFSTPYTCCQPRVTNIRRGAAILDGTVIPPNGRFSLNETLGERTRARGFVPAPQINAGRLEDAVGGGVSQIATTTFNAAFFAGLRIDSHTPHEFWISRYPPGREATISWGGPELIVTNDWPAGVLIRAEATDTGITVRMYSSRLGRRVTTTTVTPEGTVGAFPVRVTRKVYRGDRLLRDETFRWSYRTPPAE